MTILYVTKYSTKRYGVTFQKNAWIRVQKFEDNTMIKILYIV